MDSLGSALKGLTLLLGITLRAQVHDPQNQGEGSKKP